MLKSDAIMRGQEHAAWSPLPGKVESSSVPAHPLVMLLLQLLCPLILSRYIRLYLFSIDVVIGQGSVHLSQTQMARFIRNLFRTESQFKPAQNTSHRDSRSVAAGPSPPYLRSSCNRGAVLLRPQPRPIRLANTGSSCPRCR